MEVGLVGTGYCEYNESPEMCKNQHATMTGTLQPPLAAPSSHHFLWYFMALIKCQD